jgi:hypothetical protein
MVQLAVEEEFFRVHEAQLAQRFAGKVLVIRGRKVVAVYERRCIAEREATREFGGQAFIVKTIGSEPATSQPL